MKEQEGKEEGLGEKIQLMEIVAVAKITPTDHHIGK